MSAEKTSVLTFNKRTLGVMMALYGVFGIISVYQIYLHFASPTEGMMAKFDGFFMVVWVLGTLFCTNGFVRMLSRFIKKKEAVEADANGFTLNCFADYPSVFVSWINIVRIVSLSDYTAIELRDPGDLLSRLNPLDRFVVYFGRFIAGTPLIKDDYTGRGAGSAVLLRTNLLGATSLETASALQREFNRRKAQAAEAAKQ